MHTHTQTLEQQEDGFRNKGITTTSGKIFKGTMNEAPIKLNVSSIPSKFQNVIYRNSSRPAFGDSTKKFFKLSTNDSSLLPGPGQYNLSNSFFNNTESKKGSGFFASQTKLHRLQRARSHVPGPGAYKSIGFKPKSINKKSIRNKSQLNSSKSTAILSSQIQARDLFRSQIDNAKYKPSVGTYQLNPQRLIKSQSTNSAFKSKIDRFTISTTIEEIPPVGHYELSNSANKISPTKKFVKNREQSQFQRQVKLKKAIKNLQKREQKQKLGPGTYQPNLSQTTKTFKIKDTIYDRFGQLKPIYRLANAIETQREQDNKMNIINKFNPSKTYNSIFKSTTQRQDIKLTNIMDPGKYNNNKSPPKKSHLINFMQKWV